MNRWLNDIHMAALFWTRLPLPALKEYSSERFSAALWAFLPVGALIGALAGLVHWGAGSLFPSLPAAFITVAFLVLLTGGLHEDGLADVADGFGANGDRARRLDIMRDSRLGTFGVLALVFSFGFRVSCIAYLAGGTESLLVLLAAACGSRSLFAVLLWWLPPARTDGLAATMGRVSPVSAVLLPLLGAGIVVLCLGPLRGLLAVGLVMVLVTLLGMLALRKIGGQTGDLLGCTQQIVEMAILLAAVG